MADPPLPPIAVSTRRRRFQRTAWGAFNGVATVVVGAGVALNLFLSIPGLLGVTLAIGTTVASIAAAPFVARWKLRGADKAYDPWGAIDAAQKSGRALGAVHPDSVQATRPTWAAMEHAFTLGASAAAAAILDVGATMVAEHAVASEPPPVNLGFAQHISEQLWTKLVVVICAVYDDAAVEPARHGPAVVERMANMRGAMVTAYGRGNEDFAHGGPEYLTGDVRLHTHPSTDGMSIDRPSEGDIRIMAQYPEGITHLMFVHGNLHAYTRVAGRRVDLDAVEDALLAMYGVADILVREGLDRPPQPADVWSTFDGLDAVQHGLNYGRGLIPPLTAFDKLGEITNPGTTNHLATPTNLRGILERARAASNGPGDEIARRDLRAVLAAAERGTAREWTPLLASELEARSSQAFEALNAWLDLLESIRQATSQSPPATPAITTSDTAWQSVCKARAEVDSIRRTVAETVAVTPTAVDDAELASRWHLVDDVAMILQVVDRYLTEDLQGAAEITVVTSLLNQPQRGGEAGMAFADLVLRYGKVRTYARGQLELLDEMGFPLTSQLDDIAPLQHLTSQLDDIAQLQQRHADLVTRREQLSESDVCRALDSGVVAAYLDTVLTEAGSARNAGMHAVLVNALQTDLHRAVHEAEPALPLPAIETLMRMPPGRATAVQALLARASYTYGSPYRSLEQRRQDWSEILENAGDVVAMLPEGSCLGAVLPVLVDATRTGGCPTGTPEPYSPPTPTRHGEAQTRPVPPNPSPGASEHYQNSRTSKPGSIRPLGFLPGTGPHPPPLTT